MVEGLMILIIFDIFLILDKVFLFFENIFFKILYLLMLSNLIFFK